MLDRKHNNPPNPIDEALSAFGDAITEAESWLDGKPVENEPQMKAVDALTKEIKAAKKAVEAAEESAAKPFYDQWKAEKARFKPTLDDLDRIVKGLVSAVDGFKRKLAAEKAEAERKAREEAEDRHKSISATLPCVVHHVCPVGRQAGGCDSPEQRFKRSHLSCFRVVLRRMARE